MSLHFGKPRQDLFVTIGKPTVDKNERELSLRPIRQITWLYGISWRRPTGFVFVGVQFHQKQEGES